MSRKTLFVTIVVTAYLFLYYILFHFGAGQELIYIMFGLSPVLVIWLAVTIIKDPKAKSRLLDEEEWGYADKNKSDLNIF